jgi:biotin synthesis protein BioG
MRTCFLKSKGENLVLFFEGYGQDEKPFAKIAGKMPADSALLCCFDYASSGELPDLASFSKVRIVAWSMGVALAPHYASGLASVVGRIAVNGTMEGIDPKLGIDPEVWDRTAATLDERGAASFRLAMCGREFRNYMRSGISRSASSMKSELLWIRSFLKEHAPEQGRFYDKACVADADIVFPPKVQRLSFKRHGVPVQEVEGAHYAPSLFEKLLTEPF